MKNVTYEALRSEFARLCASCVLPINRAVRFTEARLEFDDLSADPRVRKVGIKDGLIYVGTMPLTMVVESKVFRKAGSYLNCIDRKNKKVLIESMEDVKKRDLNDAHHPHVFASQQPCFGPRLDQIQLWFADGKLAHVALYSVAFLEIARNSNHCETASNWPELTKQEIEEWKRQRNVTSLSSHPQSSIQPPSTSRASGLVAVVSAFLSRS